MLNDFVTGKLEAKRAQRIIPNLNRLVETARENKVPVIYSNDAHYPQDVEVTRKWGNHAIKGTKGAEVIPELNPTEIDYINGRIAALGRDYGVPVPVNTNFTTMVKARELDNLES